MYLFRVVWNDGSSPQNGSSLVLTDVKSFNDAAKAYDDANPGNEIIGVECVDMIIKKGLIPED